MKKFTIVTLIVALAMILVGSAMVFCVFMSQGFDYSFLNKQTDEFVTSTINVDEKFSSVNIKETFADVSLILTDGQAYVESYHSDNTTYDVYVENDVLNIIKNEDHSMDLISINTPECYLRVYLPESDYKKLSIDATSGNAFINTELMFEDADVQSTSGSIEFVSAVSNNLSLKTTSGEISVRNIDCNKVGAAASSGSISIENAKVKNDINLDTTSGSITLDHIFPCESLIASTTSGGFEANGIVATQTLSVDSTSGSIELIDSDCENISLESTSGDIYGKLLSKKIFVTNTSSGDVTIDQKLYGDTGHFSASTTSGDIKFTLSDQSEQ